MKSPKEKAIELHRQFMDIVGMKITYSPMDFMIASQCAIKCVEEVIYGYSLVLNETMASDFNSSATEYYEAVRDELNKLTI